MKNWISYFYGINIENIHHIKNRYKFKYNDNNYVFEMISVENDKNIIDKINDIYRFNMYLLFNGIKCSEIIVNKNNEVITYIEDKIFVLLKTFDNFDKNITFDDLNNNIVKLGNINLIKKQNTWKELWSNKIDYFEYQISQLGIKYPYIRESFSYFVGLTENGIALLNFITNDDLYLVHKRINTSSTYYDLYNPFNMILDTRVRDICDYFKDCFINNKKIDVINYLENNNLTENEKQLFFIRMLYPSFYFDVYEEVMSGIEEDKIKELINKIDNYELLLTELLDYMNQNKMIIPNIEWLKRV